ncbi:hypothetical protein [Streptomyces sp. NPDC048603]|uniref:hypothetical protein n=1 Tax=Streptomyces sp. NPDC048603 TaxID=3365577 RepID=UPI00371FFFC2
MGIKDQFNEKSQDLKAKAGQAAKGTQESASARVRARQEEADRPARRPEQEDEARRSIVDDDDNF